MKTSDFDYLLPEDLIAQTPVEPRDASRLMVVDRKIGNIKKETIFSDIGQFLNPGDLLVINQTLVIPARIIAKKTITGGQVEILLLKRVEPMIWECIVGGKGLFIGNKIDLEVGIEAEILEVREGPKRIIRFSQPLSGILDEIGQIPLPPYIHTHLEKPNRYQTIFAQEPGSVAAPTAGLHFTEKLMEELSEKGITFASVTLHIGMDTFAPVKEDDPHIHEIHKEWCQIPSKTAQLVNKTKEEGGRVIAVGTTSVRTLESAVVPRKQSGYRVSEYSGFTDLFILPGYEFKIVDGIVTNFHLPRSTLILLVSAFMGRDNVLSVYQTAIKKGYRFYSFGDAMFIV